MTWLLVTTRPDGVDDDAGAERALHLLARAAAAAAEEPAEERIVEQRLAVLDRPGRRRR